MGNVKVCLYSIGEQRSPSKRNVDWLTDWHGSYGLCKMSFGKGCRTYLEYYDFVGTEVIGSGKNEVMWNPLKMYWLKSHLCYTFKKKKTNKKQNSLCRKKIPCRFHVKAGQLLKCSEVLSMAQGLSGGVGWDGQETPVCRALSWLLPTSRTCLLCWFLDNWLLPSKQLGTLLISARHHCCQLCAQLLFQILTCALKGFLL